LSSNIRIFRRCFSGSDFPKLEGICPPQITKKAIIAAIDRYLAGNRIALHPERAVSGFAERPGLFVETPPTLLPVTPRREDIQWLVRKFNPVERDFRNRKLGRDGEELVFQFERERLKKGIGPTLRRRSDGFRRKMATEQVMTSCPLTKKAENDFLR
jgi:hypothetical protein